MPAPASCARCRRVSAGTARRPPPRPPARRAGRAPSAPRAARGESRSRPARTGSSARPAGRAHRRPGRIGTGSGRGGRRSAPARRARTASTACASSRRRRRMVPPPCRVEAGGAGTPDARRTSPRTLRSTRDKRVDTDALVRRRAPSWRARARKEPSCRWQRVSRPAPFAEGAEVEGARRMPTAGDPIMCDFPRAGGPAAVLAGRPRVQSILHDVCATAQVRGHYRHRGPRYPATAWTFPLRSRPPAHPGTGRSSCRGGDSR